MEDAPPLMVADEVRSPKITLPKMGEKSDSEGSINTESKRNYSSSEDFSDESGFSDTDSDTDYLKAKQVKLTVMHDSSGSPEAAAKNSSSTKD